MTDFLSGGEILKIYDENTYKFLGSLIVESIRRTDNKTAMLMPLPSALKNRVEPDSLVIVEIRYRSGVEVEDFPNIIPDFSALIQIDKFSSEGALVQNTHFHDSYNNVRFYIYRVYVSLFSDDISCHRLGDLPLQI